MFATERLYVSQEHSEFQKASHKNFRSIKKEVFFPKFVFALGDDDLMSYFVE